MIASALLFVGGIVTGILFAVAWREAKESDRLEALRGLPSSRTKR